VENHGHPRLAAQGRFDTALAGGEHAIMELFMATHIGMPTAEFEQIVEGLDRHRETSEDR
jgi:hypothetical protein